MQQSERLTEDWEIVSGAALIAAAAFFPIELGNWLVWLIAALVFFLSEKFWPFVVALVFASMTHSAAVSDFPTLEPHSFEGSVQLADDLVGNQWGASEAVAYVTVESERYKVLLRLDSQLSLEMSDAVVGSSLVGQGQITTMSETNWSRQNRLAGVLKLNAITSEATTSWWRMIPELVRGRIFAVADYLPETSQALFTGLLIGEDSEQTPLERSQFRAAGMTHLLAVSGQNLVLVLVMLRQLIDLFPLQGRYIATVAIIVLFALVTRLEPSVLRASTVAVVGLWGAYMGSESSGLRHLALAVAALVLIDPLIARSIGFQLSVLASAGIIKLSPSLLAQLLELGAPKIFAEPLAVTISAQMFVAPLLISTFGEIGLGQVPANIAAGFLAGFVLVSGSALALLSVIFPAVAMEAFVLPVHGAIVLLQQVAIVTTQIPLPKVGLVELGFISLACFAGFVLKRWIWLAVIAAVIVLVAGSSSTWCGDATGYDIYPSVANRQVVVIRQSVKRSDLDHFVDQCGPGIELLISESGTRARAELVRGFAQAVDVPVLASRMHSIPGARRVTESFAVPVLGGELQIEPGDSYLQVIFSRG